MEGKKFKFPEHPRSGSKAISVEEKNMREERKSVLDLDSKYAWTKNQTENSIKE